MSNSIFDIDFIRALPPTLKNDENMLSLAKTIASELKTTVKLSRQNLIYARIDELDEKILDILAYDFHVDWYDYDYPIEIKRAILKNSVRVHKRLGTKYAIKIVLEDAFPRVEISEWFEYGGEPYHFKLFIEVGNNLCSSMQYKIVEGLKHYKNVRSHLESVTYRAPDVDTATYITSINCNNYSRVNLPVLEPDRSVTDRVSILGTSTVHSISYIDEIEPNRHVTDTVNIGSTYNIRSVNHIGEVEPDRSITTQAHIGAGQSELLRSYNRIGEVEPNRNAVTNINIGLAQSSALHSINATGEINPDRSVNADIDIGLAQSSALYSSNNISSKGGEVNE